MKRLFGVLMVTVLLLTGCAGDKPDNDELGKAVDSAVSKVQDVGEGMVSDKADERQEPIDKSEESSAQPSTLEESDEDVSRESESELEEGVPVVVLHEECSEYETPYGTMNNIIFIDIDEWNATNDFKLTVVTEEEMAEEYPKVPDKVKDYTFYRAPWSWVEEEGNRTNDLIAYDSEEDDMYILYSEVDEYGKAHVKAVQIARDNTIYLSGSSGDDDSPYEKVIATSYLGEEVDASAYMFLMFMFGGIDSDMRGEDIVLIDSAEAYSILTDDVVQYVKNITGCDVISDDMTWIKEGTNVHAKDTQSGSIMSMSCFMGADGSSRYIMVIVSDDEIGIDCIVINEADIPDLSFSME